MSKMKKWLGLTFALLLIVAVTGAAQSTAQPKDTVVVWEKVFWPGAQAWFDALKQTYESMMQAVGRDVELVVDLLPEGSSEEKWQTAFLAGNLPDFSRGLYGAGIPGLIKEDMVLDLRPYLTKQERGQVGGEKVFQVMTGWYGGPIVGMPSEARFKPTEWAINADLVRQAGYDPLKIVNEGWTFDDVIKIAQKANNPSKGIYGFGQSGDRLWRVDYAIMESRDISKLGWWNLTPDGEWAWNDQGTLAALSLYYDLMYKYNVWPREFLGMKGDQVEQMFAQGKIAIIDSGLGVVTRTVAAWNKAIKDGTQKGTLTNAYAVILPRAPFMKKHQTMYQVDEGLFVFKKKDQSEYHTQNVIALLKLLMGPLGQSRVALQGNWPANSLTREAFYQLLDPNDPRWALEKLRYSTLTDRAPEPTLSKEQQQNFPKIETLWNTLLKQMMEKKGALLPADLIKQVNAEAVKQGFKIAPTNVVK